MREIHSRRVVIPVDPADLPFKALKIASELVDSLESAHVLAVLPASENTARGANWGTIDGESRSDYAIRDLKARLAQTPYADAQVHVVFGTPAEEIVKFAEEVHADLIVLPCRNQQGRLDRLMKGSVAENLIRISACPVLAVPLNPDARTEVAPEPPKVSPSEDPPGHRGRW